MNAFDKVCAVLAFILAVPLVVLGVVGLFTGCRAHFSLPPMLGVLPALAGWGIIKSVLVALKGPARPAPMAER